MTNHTNQAVSIFRRFKKEEFSKSEKISTNKTIVNLMKQVDSLYANPTYVKFSNSELLIPTIDNSFFLLNCLPTITKDKKIQADLSNYVFDLIMDCLKNQEPGNEKHRFITKVRLTRFIRSNNYYEIKLAMESCFLLCSLGELTYKDNPMAHPSREHETYHKKLAILGRDLYRLYISGNKKNNEVTTLCNVSLNFMKLSNALRSLIYTF